MRRSLSINQAIGDTLEEDFPGTKIKKHRNTARNRVVPFLAEGDASMRQRPLNNQASNNMGLVDERFPTT